MLQVMRSAAKYLWIVLAVAFVVGYLLLDTSGLLGRQLVTTGTAVGEVEGTEITYGQWMNRAEAMVQQQQQYGQAIDMDARAQLEDQAFEELVMDVLMQREYRRRGIRVTDEEIIQAARFAPPPALMQSPELQTDGRFDPAKWERFLASPAIQQQGVLVQLQQYYEDQIPREKLFAQVIGEVYVSDARLWRMYQDANDSASMSFVQFRPAPGADSALRSAVSDAEIRAYYEENAKNLTTPARAVVTAIVISRVPTAADTAAGRARLAEVRARITGGAKFEDVAREVSEDSASAVDGGNLGKQAKGAWIKEFEDAAFAMRAGQLSEPVRTQEGWHLIRVDERKGDSVSARHILIRHRQSDSSATATDRLADRISRLAGGATVGARLDTAAADAGLPLMDLEVIEGQRALSPNGRPLPGLSQWATKSGARVGEVSELLDGDDAYFIARLDSLVPGGEPPLARIRDDIARYLARQKAVEALRGDAQAFAAAAVSSSFETAARARNLTIETAKPFTRIAFVPGIGQSNAAVGAAFSLSVGAISAPIVTDAAVFVIRVDRRWNVTREAWDAQRPAQRAAIEQQLQQDRYRQYLAAIRAEAKVVDKRKEVLAASRMEVPATPQQ